MNPIGRHGFWGVLLLGFCLLPAENLWAQAHSDLPRSASVLRFEALYGQSAEANDFFPERSPQYSLIAAYGYRPNLNDTYWAKTLNGMEVGLLGMYTNLGNPTALGASFTLLPYVRFPFFGTWTNKIRAQFGLGATYFDTVYDQDTNFFNQAVTTPITWAFRGSVHYDFWRFDAWQFGLGGVYNHQSNGHTKLPNQGLNSFLLSLSAEHLIGRSDRTIDLSPSQQQTVAGHANPDNESGQDAPQAYLEARFGFGMGIFALAFNDLRPVRTVELTYGKMHQRTFKWGVGLQYRFYQHYYDYIKGNESLVQDGAEFADFRSAPGRYAANIGLHLDGELLLNHFGINAQLGVNLYKPAYNIDWRINQGWDYPPRELPPNWVLGQYNTKFELKKHISTRLGLRYYLWSQALKPVQNIFVGAHLNANFGQADFSEISLGYVYAWDR